MQDADEVSLASIWLPSAQRKLLASGVLATVLAMAELYNGSVTKVLRYVKRYDCISCHNTSVRLVLRALALFQILERWPDHITHVSCLLCFDEENMLCRSCAAAFAQWIENQGGFPLFTIEGEIQTIATET